ncbi:nuclease-related domain-containing protein [Neobacillus sp. 179-C4.2 HS]|uniref:Nuclease-related domain-containing protein n=1 Tax=Neobacillus driksii TaxID=3035913 RepID=A0ABV4YY91_9BACI|nr:nuclease-related domain-containing protein [Neobacillus sp. 179.-C4.2 HS]MDP5194390.1 nuclease-related domain-containing protein [Neobacillus sp. 179.-C4.2 HS]
MKERSDSLTLMGLIAAQSRLPDKHPMISVIASKQSILEAGIGGEQQVADVLGRYRFPFRNNIFHDLSLSSDTYFQIDHLLKTPHYGVVLETKNLAGSLEFRDNPPQLIQKREDGQIKYYESPVVQLERNIELFSAWLSERNIDLPLYGAIVLAYPKQHVDIPPADTKILFPNLVPPFIKSLPREGKGLDTSTFNWLSSELLRCHQTYIPKPVCESYQIPVSAIKPGVRCEACGKLGMIKIPRTWHCRFCKVNNHLAHRRALVEWLLVVKRTITNGECREFLGVDIHTATRILQSLPLRSNGTFRNKSYLLDFKMFPFK